MHVRLQCVCRVRAMESSGSTEYVALGYVCVIIDNGIITDEIVIMDDSVDYSASGLGGTRRVAWMCCWD